MVSLLKTFGKGILYVIGLPFFIVALLLFGVFGLFAFIFQLFRSIIFFFTGQKFFPELPEDKQLRIMRDGPEAEESPVVEQSSPTQPEKEQTIIYPYIEEPEAEKPISEEEVLSNMAREETIEEACFGGDLGDDQIEESSIEDDEEPVEEETAEEEEESAVKEDSEEEACNEDIVETRVEEPVEDDDIDELEVYVPESSKYSDDIFDDDTDDDDGGVDIRFDV